MKKGPHLGALLENFRKDYRFLPNSQSQKLNIVVPLLQLQENNALTMFVCQSLTKMSSSVRSFTFRIQ